MSALVVCHDDDEAEIYWHRHIDKDSSIFWSVTLNPKVQIHYLFLWYFEMSPLKLNFNMRSPAFLLVFFIFDMAPIFGVISLGRNFFVEKSCYAHKRKTCLCVHSTILFMQNSQEHNTFFMANSISVFLSLFH